MAFPWEIAVRIFVKRNSIFQDTTLPKTVTKLPHLSPKLYISQYDSKHFPLSLGKCVIHPNRI